MSKKQLAETCKNDKKSSSGATGFNDAKRNQRGKQQNSETSMKDKQEVAVEQKKCEVSLQSSTISSVDSSQHTSKSSSPMKQPRVDSVEGLNVAERQHGYPSANGNHNAAADIVRHDSLSRQQKGVHVQPEMPPKPTVKLKGYENQSAPTEGMNYQRMTSVTSGDPLHATASSSTAHNHLSSNHVNNINSDVPLFSKVQAVEGQNSEKRNRTFQIKSVEMVYQDGEVSDDDDDDEEYENKWSEYNNADCNTNFSDHPQLVNSYSNVTADPRVENVDALTAGQANVPTNGSTTMNATTPVLTDSTQAVDSEVNTGGGPRFKLVKINDSEPFKRGRWICRDNEQLHTEYFHEFYTTDIRNDAECIFMNDMSRGSGSSSAASSIYYVPDDSSTGGDNPLTDVNQMVESNGNVPHPLAEHPATVVPSDGQNSSGADSRTVPSPTKSVGQPHDVPATTVASAVQPLRPPRELQQGVHQPRRDMASIPGATLLNDLTEGLDQTLPVPNTFQQANIDADTNTTAGQESGVSGDSTVAIDNKIEQAMDLVKSHLMYAVREEVEILKEQIKELVERNSSLEELNSNLEAENSLLKEHIPNPADIIASKISIDVQQKRTTEQLATQSELPPPPAQTVAQPALIQQQPTIQPLTQQPPPPPLQQTSPSPPIQQPQHNFVQQQATPSPTAPMQPQQQQQPATPAQQQQTYVQQPQQSVQQQPYVEQQPYIQQHPTVPQQPLPPQLPGQHPPQTTAQQVPAGVAQQLVQQQATQQQQHVEAPTQQDTNVKLSDSQANSLPGAT